MSSESISNNGYTHQNRVRIIKGGAHYFRELVRLIDRAQHTIHLRIYIFIEDTTGRTIGEALKKAAQRKVSVYVLADGYASQGLSRKFIRQLQEAGVHFRFFEPLLRSSHFYFGRRMHEKVFVADGFYALVGGINIADRYNEVRQVPPWLDYALFVEGETAAALHRICARAWGIDTLQGSAADPAGELFPSIPPEEYCSVRIRRNDWVKSKREIWKTYFNFFNHAQESITILCSYFIPGRVLRNRLKLAAKKGVKVKVILAGPSDVMLAKYAERYLYAWMLRHHIEIFEYQPTVLHAKMTLVDNHYVTIGSYNINNVSTYASMELNLDVRNRVFASLVKKELEGIMLQDCIQITEKNFATNATLFGKFLQKSAYEIIRVILNLSTFYFKPE
ncbi:MAG: phospholipase D-like domain-containing protein [Flavisolibacter sp.]